MKKVIMLILTVAVLLSGCWDQKIYEQIGFILSVGIELSEEEGKLLLTYTSPVVGTAKKGEVEILHTTADILREARENVSMKSPKTLEAGKIQEFLFSEELAKKGIHSLLEVLQRDPLNPALAWVVVVEGSPGELLEAASKFEDKPKPAVYVSQILESVSRSSYVPETRVYDFDINYFAPGIDPMVPLLRLTEDDIMVIGSALFKGDKMTGKIDRQQTALLLAMKGMMKTTVFICRAPQSTEELLVQKEMAVSMKAGKRNLNIKIENNKPAVNISLELFGSVDDYKWDELRDSSLQEKLEKYLGEEIKKECMKTLKYLQHIGSDPIGIGDIVRARHNSYWKSANWEEAYREAEFNVEVKVEIMNYGAIQ